MRNVCMNRYSRRREIGFYPAARETVETGRTRSVALPHGVACPGGRRNSWNRRHSDGALLRRTALQVGQRAGDFSLLRPRADQLMESTLEAVGITKGDHKPASEHRSTLVRLDADMRASRVRMGLGRRLRRSLCLIRAPVRTGSRAAAGPRGVEVSHQSTRPEADFGQSLLGIEYSAKLLALIKDEPSTSCPSRGLFLE